MTTTIGGVTVADPDTPLNISYEMIGSDQRTFDGTLLRDFSNKKRTWGLTWSWLSFAQRNTLKTQLDILTAQSFSPPDIASTFTVLVDYNSYSESVITSGRPPTNYYTVNVTLKEQ